MKIKLILKRLKDTLPLLKDPGDGATYLALFTVKPYYAVRIMNNYYFAVQKLPNNDAPALLTRIMKDNSDFRRLNMGAITFFITPIEFKPKNPTNGPIRRTTRKRTPPKR